MSYIDNNLVSGESVIYREQLHWQVFLKGLGAILLALLPLGFTVYQAEPLPHAIEMAFTVAAIFLFGWGGLLLLLAFIDTKTSEFAVTDKRLMFKTGLIRRDTLELFLDRVESIQVEQSILGRLMNFGTLVVTGTGAASSRFDAIASPLMFRRMIQEQIAAFRDPGSPRHDTKDDSGGGT